jgi:beta-glucosidase
MAVTNTGRVAGREVVQLYLTAPQGKLEKPLKELKGFAKTRLLAPGETEILSFVIKPEQLASFSESKGAWIAEAGEYQLKLATSSDSEGKTARFMLAKELNVQTVQVRMRPSQAIQELNRSNH